ncbi:MAG TPA: LacI family DNA-binding transcriptional regulator [Phycisphaerae bacterium]|nr:LacI family DNA-binding transcriptional regulator [Phycisphaerae bacterium]
MTVTRIAEKAGVSIATVSRVLNNSRPVDPAIVERVHKAVEQLGIRGSTQSRRRGRLADREIQVPTTIAIVSLGQRYREWFEVPVIAGVVAELNRAAQESHMGVMMAEMPDPTELNPVLRRSGAAGAIVFISSETQLTTKDAALLRSQFPVVRVMGWQLSVTDIDHVCPDHNAIGHLASQYLLEQGLTNLAYLTTQPTWDFAKQRAQGFMAGAEAAGISPTMYLQDNQSGPLGTYGVNTVREKELERLIDRMAETRKGRFGLFIFRDAETVHIYPLLRAKGLEPGRDVIVVSCDNEAIRLSALQPRPASIDLGAAEIAHLAVSRLSRRIQHKNEPPARILVSPRLVTGEGQAVTTSRS